MSKIKKYLNHEKNIILNKRKIFWGISKVDIQNSVDNSEDKISVLKKVEIQQKKKMKISRSRMFQSQKFQRLAKRGKNQTQIFWGPVKCPD